MSGVCLKVAVGASGKGGGRALYDTRVPATRGEHERVWTQNVPEYVDRGDEVSYKERRSDLAEFIRQLEEDEMSKSRDSGDDNKKERTFYRLIYSFHDDPGDEKVKEMVSEHQRECLPKAYIINAIHRNSGHVHVHSVVAARQKDGSKLHLDWREYRTLDDKWAHIYGREFGEHFEREHLAKKEERRQQRIHAREAISRGERPPPRPARETHRRNQVEEKVKTYERESGVRRADERGTTGRGGRAAAGIGGDEGRGRVRSIGAQGRAVSERESAPQSTVNLELDDRRAARDAAVIRGEGRTTTLKGKRRGGRDGRGGRALGGAGGGVEVRGGGARLHDRTVADPSRRLPAATPAAERLDDGRERQAEAGGEGRQTPALRDQQAGGPDRALRGGTARGAGEPAVDSGRDIRTAGVEAGLLGGADVRSGAGGGVGVHNQLDSKLADAISEFTRTVAQEKERDEQYREADRAASAPQSREEGLGAPQRDGPEPGRDAPDRDGPQRDAPTISFER